METIDLSNFKYLKFIKQLKGKLRKTPEHYEYCLIEDYENKYLHAAHYAIPLREFYYKLLEIDGAIKFASILLPGYYDRDRIIEFLEHHSFSFNQKDEKGFFIAQCSSIYEGLLFKRQPIILGRRGRRKYYYDISEFEEATQQQLPTQHTTQQQQPCVDHRLAANSRALLHVMG